MIFSTVLYLCNNNIYLQYCETILVKTIITILGFDTSQVFSAIIKDGISSGDKIIILKPKEDKSELRGEKAYNEIKNLIKQISPAISIQKIVLSTHNFSQMIEEISNIFTHLEEEIVVNISGGVREIAIALTTVSILYNQKISRIYNFSRIEGEIREIELPYFAYPLTGNEKRILDLITTKGPLKYNELVNELRLSKSSISRIASELEKNSIIKIEDVGKEKRIHPTLTGKLIQKI